MSAHTDHTFSFGAGSVSLDAEGCVAAVTRPDGRPMLLTDDPDAVEAGLHEPARRWGTGFALLHSPADHTPTGYRWHRPDRLVWRPDGVDLDHGLGPLRLRVRRRIGRVWRETHHLQNESDAPVVLGSFAVSTPWRDVYGSSQDSLHRAVHAHVWTGGDDAWVWAAPMDGSGPGLGLMITEGALWAYSVESRDTSSGSNVRGHLYLHVTDRSRAPHTLGGQPEIVVAPGAELRLEWRLDWHDDLAGFGAARRRERPPLVDPVELSAVVGTPVQLRSAAGVRVEPVGPPDPAGLQLYEAERDGRRARVAVLRHHPLRDLVRARLRFALDHQRPVEEPGARASAFVPYDTATGSRVLAGGWRDWNDARERVGTALLLQRARDLDWTGGDFSAAEVTDALAGYQQFVNQYLVAEDGTVGDDSRHPDVVRLYNFPWFARFLAGQGDQDAVARIVECYYALGGDHFLAFGLGPLTTALASTLDEARQPERADRLRKHLRRHVAAMLAHGDNLPAHEVNYEQSMVAPLLELLLSGRRLDPAAVPIEELDRRLRWLTAFAADQPDARLRHVPIRHWDGYWFGLDRRWGDTFPHYWSVLSAEVFLDWPAELVSSSRYRELQEMGAAILRANLASFRLDGTATCAFVYPSCVNGRPAHVADPLINDQDWALVSASHHLDLVG